MIDTHSGSTVSAVPCPGDADDIWFDKVTGLLYQTGGDHIGIFKLATSTGALTMVQTVQTSGLARTSHFDAVHRQLFVAVARLADRRGKVDPAAVWVYDVLL